MCLLPQVGKTLNLNISFASHAGSDFPKLTDPDQSDLIDDLQSLLY